MKISKNKVKKATLLITLVFSVGNFSFGQDDLLQILEEEEKSEKIFSESTFKGTRMINGHSIETRSKGALEFIISLRNTEDKIINYQSIICSTKY